ncbi:Lrp/AsnC family transcriptional regulator [Natrinema longum]|uniref:Lrp/AsnC family transcriptional regulator n=1 Tax=Natrinema longum TaxID=370324 RepID=A0A8A2UCC4_9EURY|nr:Lrp/AsnC family transcriptional regulator [Natrinema longum]MBZ6495824.1 Lrp/AsnC family transcriptional regulator [Natrinema longum]QSW86234.1 Lrp/AsnC family transcriptional regulator [Natrinema longum]
MNNTLDERDIKILFAIADRETDNTEVLHEETGIPKSTVHYRLQNLKEEGVITNDLYELDLDEVGLGLTVISEIWAEFGEGYQERVGEQLAAIEGVNQVYFTMGDTDFIVIGRLTSRDMVEGLVEDYESIDEITRTSSKFVISTIKTSEGIGTLRDYGLDSFLEAHGLSADEE